MSKYLSISEAASILGVSSKTIRRRLDKLSKSLSKYVKRDGHKITIDERLVRSNFSGVDVASNDIDQDNANSTLLRLLEEELKAKEEQLKAKDKQLEAKQRTIDNLTIIIAKYQDQDLRIEQPIDDNKPQDIEVEEVMEEEQKPKEEIEQSKKRKTRLGRWLGKAIDRTMDRFKL